jgi:hypothetical protein
MKEQILFLERTIREIFSGHLVIVLQDEKKRRGDYKGWVRLQISCNADLPPKEIASTMAILIQETKEILSFDLGKTKNLE